MSGPTAPKYLRVWAGYESRGWLFKPTYRLRVCAAATDAARVLLARHRLYGDVIWRSPASIQAEAQGSSRLDLADEVAGHDRAALAKRLRLRREGLALLRIAERVEARCLVGEVFAANGKELQSRDVAEVASAETQIIAGLKALEHRLQKLRDYDDRQEWRHDAEDVATSSPAEGWLRRVL